MNDGGWGYKIIDGDDFPVFQAPCCGVVSNHIQHFAKNWLALRFLAAHTLVENFQLGIGERFWRVHGRQQLVVTWITA